MNFILMLRVIFKEAKDEDYDYDEDDDEEEEEEEENEDCDDFGCVSLHCTGFEAVPPMRL